MPNLYLAVNRRRLAFSNTSGSAPAAGSAPALEEEATLAQRATPSTCVQFGARTEKSFDTTAAGYRLLQLDENFHTEVHRLSGD